MAEVYRADQELAPGIFRPAALKVIRPEYSESEDFREMFLDEARTACTLSHPNIVHIYEVGEADGLIYMGMELVPGESLSAVAKALREKGERLPDAALLAVGIFTCSALEAVHALELPGGGHVKLVHRDVSPHNLLLSSTGSLKLIDFGIAKAATNRSLTNPGVTKGKAGYFSPEQAMGKTLDGRSDLFSVGVTLYKLASGVTPFDKYTNHYERNSALVAGKWEPLEKVTPGLLPGFYEVVRQALQLKPQDRYENAAAMREALENVAFEAGIGVGPAALAGFVEERNGQISVNTTISRVSGLSRPSGSKRRLTPIPAPQPAVAAPPPPAPAVPAKAILAGASVLGLLVIGSVAALLLRDRTPELAPVPVQVQAQPVAAVQPPAPKPTPPPVEPSSAAAEPPTQPKAEPRPRAPKIAADHRVRAPKPPAPDEEGMGELRVGSTPPGEVRVAGKRESTPTRMDLKSGHYMVRISIPGQPKEGSCIVNVLANKKMFLRYDATTANPTCKVEYHE